MLAATRVFLRRLIHRRRFESGLTEELQFHLDARMEELVRRGLDPAEAHRQARIEFGGVAQYEERLRGARPGAMLDALAQDVRLSVRRLRREPGFALSVALTLSLGIGASTAVFGLLSTTSLGHIPFAEPGRLVVGRTTQHGEGAGQVSTPDYFDYRESNHAFESLAAFWAHPRSATVTGSGEPWAAVVVNASWNLFPTWRVDPVVGRHFLQEEEARPDARLVMVSHGVWQKRFGGTSDIVGRSLVLGGVPHTVVGVLPRSFRFSALESVLGSFQPRGRPMLAVDVDLWPLLTRPGEARHLHNYYLLGRLKPGVSTEQAQGDVDRISGVLEETYPDSNRGKGLELVSLQEYLGGAVRAGLLLPAAAAGCLLLIACANVAGLLLARGQRRMPEMAMRATLGGSPWRLVRQLLTESVVFTIPAGLLGVGVAYFLQGLLLFLVPADRLCISHPVIDGTVLCFALAMAVATGLLVGVVPALRGVAARPLPHFGASRRPGQQGDRARLRSAFVVAQISISVVLLVGSGLLARSLVRLSEVDLGFSPRRVLTARVDIAPADDSDRARRQAFFASLLEEVGRLPGVRSVGATTSLPIQDAGNTWPVRAADGSLASSDPAVQPDDAKLRFVSARYFEAMGMEVRQGRGILATDRDDAPAVTVISESLARRLYAGRNPVGRTLVLIDFINTREVPYEIVGVARDARLSGPREEGDRAMYVSMLQASPGRLRLAIRTDNDAASLAPAVREILRRKDRNALMTDVQTMEVVVDEAFAHFRMTVRYLGLFAVAALLLAAVGLYGALAYDVSRQEHEIGVRVAMGATQGSVFAHVVRRAIRLVAVGLALGLAVAYPGARLVQGMLFEITPLDPAAYTGAALLLVVVAAAACLLPARRATQVDPSVVLRSE